MARITRWNGKDITLAVARNVASALGEFALRAEGHSKRVLRRGHGVLTGTARRSIHVAQPGYNWAADDVEPATGSPERGGKAFDAVIDGKRITVQLGSGLGYALPLHQGHHSFEGYHFLTIGVEKAKPELPTVLKKYRLKK
jgi:hypothetical protein